MICGTHSKTKDILQTDIILNNDISEQELYQSSGVIDYVDASEGEGMRLKKSHTLLTELEKETHIELHPSLILGFMGNQIIFPENNPYQEMLFHVVKPNRVFPYIIQIIKIELIKRV